MGRKSWAHWISGSCPNDLKKSDFNELIQVIIELNLHYVYVVLWNSALIFFFHSRVNQDYLVLEVLKVLQELEYRGRR